MSEKNEQVERIIEEAKHKILAVFASIEPEKVEIEVPQIDENLVSIKVAAKRIGISESQLRALEKKGLVPSYRPGGILRFDVAEVREAVRSKKPNLRAVS